VIDDASHEKAKKKGKPGYKDSRLVKTFFVALLVVFAIPILLMLLLTIKSRFGSPFFDAQQVTETCQILDLPTESDFCADPETQMTETLIKAIELIYPTELTTISELKPHFSRMNCMETYCRVDLPLKWFALFIDYNEEGQVQRYYMLNIQM
jgi:hypothetical protein